MPATITDRKAFDIRDHQESLTPTKNKGRYICPVCTGNNLTIDNKNGAYQCWNGCECKDIRDAIAPINLSDSLPFRSSKPRKQRKAKKPKPVPLPEKIELAQLEGEVTHPQAKDIGNGKTSTTYDYEGGRTVERIDYSNGKKQVYPYYLDDSGQRRKGIKQGDTFPPYRIEEVQAGKAILMGEGEKCAEMARFLGFVATTPQGAAWGKLETIIARLKSEGITAIAYLPDLDQPGFKKAEKVREACAAEKMPCLILNLADILDNKEVKKGYDLADYIMDISDKAKAIADLERLLQLSIDNGNGGGDSDNYDDGDDGDDSDRLNSHQVAYQAICRYFAPKHNGLTKHIEIDGKPCNIDESHAVLGIDYGIKTKIGEFTSALALAAKRNAYHPIQDYLKDCKAQYGNDTSILEGLAERYFGASDPIYQAMLKRFLIGAVARVMNPGCKNDTMLILKGKQGIRKSTFFRVLSNDWFTDSMAGVESKDDQLIPHQAWFVEWGEFERSYRKADNSVIKAYMSRCSDLIRPPYGRSAEDMQRGFVLVGSTNESQFLNDATGSRRFWVIPVAGKIDTDLLEQERDRIWAAALALWEKGENWWLSDLEEKARQDAAKAFESRDVWEDVIAAEIEKVEGVTTSGILANVLEIEVARQGRKEQMRLSEILTRLGFEKKSKRIQGIPQKVWRKVVEADPMPSEIEITIPPESQKSSPEDECLNKLQHCQSSEAYSDIRSNYNPSVVSAAWGRLEQCHRDRIVTAVNAVKQSQITETPQQQTETVETESTEKPQKNQEKQAETQQAQESPESSENEEWQQRWEALEPGWHRFYDESDPYSLAPVEAIFEPGLTARLIEKPSVEGELRLEKAFTFDSKKNGYTPRLIFDRKPINDLSAIEIFKAE